MKAEMTAAEYALRVAKKCGEGAFLTRMKDEAHRNRWLFHHTRNSVQVDRATGRVRHLTAIEGNPGYPDVTLAHNSHPLVLLEFKTWTNRRGVSIDQERWIRKIRSGGGLAGVVTPLDEEWVIDLLNRGIALSGLLPKPAGLWLTDARGTLYGPGTMAADHDCTPRRNT